MATSGIGSTGTSTVDRSNLPQQTDPYSNLKMEDFIQLMITEMQNQDPMNPMDNSQLLQQMSSMQSINSTQKLTTTLDSVLLGQNLSNAGALIGKTIDGLTSDGKEVTGKVTQATLVNNIPYLSVSGEQVPISNVRYILPEGAQVVDSPTGTDPNATAGTTGGADPTAATDTSGQNTTT